MMPTPFRSPLAPALAALVLVVDCSAADPAAADVQATALWKDFLVTYRKFSLKQLSDAELDALARERLIASLGARYRNWNKDEYADLAALIAAVRQREPERSAFDLTERALAVLLPAIDRYGRYEAAADVARFLEAGKQRSGGSVQMAIELDDAKRLLCFPQPDGPAAQAKVLPGAELLEVDGIPVERKELAAVKFAFIGPPLSKVKVKVRQPHGKIEELEIGRDKEPPLIAASVSPLGLDVRIRRFDRGAAKELREIFREHADAKRLTLDLRGNPGGRREEAFLAASLFFPEGEVIGKFTSREGEEEVKDGNAVEISPTTIRILIDRRTASGAEYLAAALREGLPGKVRIFGEKSYGKGQSTVQVGLEGGGLVMITEAELATHSGLKWDQVGLQPDGAPAE